MANDSYKLSISDDGGSRVVKRDLDAVAKAGQAVQNTIAQLQSMLAGLKKSLPGTEAQSSARALNEMAKATVAQGAAGAGATASNQRLRSALGDLLGVISGTMSGTRRLAAEMVELSGAEERAARGANVLSSSMGAMRNVLLSVGLGFTAREAIQTADAYRVMENQLTLVTAGTDNLRAVQEELYDVSQRNGIALEATTELFSKMSRASRVLGTSQQEVLEISESVSQALAISGASAQAASGVILQFSQGVGAGLLGGAELVAVLEGAPRLASALAEGIMEDTEMMKRLGLQGTITAIDLKKLGAQGKLTSDVVLAAMKNSADNLKEEFSKVKFSVATSMQIVQNSSSRVLLMIES